MRKQQLEDSARTIITRVIAGKSVEDSGIELKTEWISAEKAARRLAAHANAARGEAIIWLMGINERRKSVAGVEAEEMSNWIKTVAAQFDGEPPNLTCHANIHYPEGTVVALYFETEATPYVVKNPDGGKIQFEVPYRRGTDTKSANRADLLRILLPRLKYPTVELLNAKLNLFIDRNIQENVGMLPVDKFDWSFTADLYLTPKTKDPIIIPHKNCCLHFKVNDFTKEFHTLPISFQAIGNSLTAKYSASELIITGPCSVGIEAKGHLIFDSRVKMAKPEGIAEIGIEIKPAYAEKKMLIRQKLRYDATPRNPFSSFLFKPFSVWH